MSIFIGLILSGISYILIGPDRFTDIVPDPYLTSIFMCFAQMLTALVFIPTVPEFVECLQEKFPDMEEDVVSSVSSGLYNSAFAVS